MYEGHREGVTKKQGMAELGKTEKNDSEISDIFPALEKYKAEHNLPNLQKLLVEVAEFCRSIYASTQNEAEREAYYRTLDKLSKR